MTEIQATYQVNSESKKAPTLTETEEVFSGMIDDTPEYEITQERVKYLTVNEPIPHELNLTITPKEIET